MKDSPRAEPQGDGQPENPRELEDTSGGAAMRARNEADGGELPEGGMGGTSAAGSAADDAAEAAAYGRGTSHDITQPPAP